MAHDPPFHVRSGYVSQDARSEGDLRPIRTIGVERIQAVGSRVEVRPGFGRDFLAGDCFNVVQILDNGNVRLDPMLA
jgi:hypothetical protein